VVDSLQIGSPQSFPPDVYVLLLTSPNWDSHSDWLDQQNTVGYILELPRFGYQKLCDICPGLLEALVLGHLL